MRQIAFDCETFPIGPGAIAPKIICASFYDGERALLVGNDDLDALKGILRDVLDNYEVITHNGSAFDLGVVANNFPELIPNIFQALEDNRIHDTIIREKLHNLGQYGKIDFIELPDGTSSKVSYSLSNLEKKYLGRDRSEEKTEEDAWRTNYAVLDGQPIESYPEQAQKYALDDAIYTYQICQQQQEKCCNLGTEWLHVRANFCLFLMTIVGWRVDHAAVKEVEAMVSAELTEDKLKLIVEAGILRPGQPARPKKRGEGMVAAKPPSVNRAALQERILSLCCQTLRVPVKLTAKGAQEQGESWTEDPSIDPKWVSTDTEVIQELALHDPVIEQYRHRQEQQKLVTTYLPAFYWEDEPVERIHATYDVLKETGRTSSHSNRLYPSCNIQQVDPRVRQCFVADPGFILASADYSSLELVSLAWKTYKLFGKSKMWDLLQEGVDLHAYLAGTQLAPSLSPEFRAAVKGLDLMERYEVFIRSEEKNPEFYDHYRTFAKPTGLGYPGGLGPETFISYAKATYKINVRDIAKKLGVKQGTFPDVNLDTEDPGILLAAHLRNLWFEAFPEMRMYFERVNDLPQSLEGSFRYETPLGMVRNGASYCAAANGWALQSPSAEGAKIAIWEVVKNCWLPNTILSDCIPLAFIHDQIILQVPDDVHRDDRAHALCELMVDGMKEVLTDAPIKAEPVLMYRWDKKAKTVYDDRGRLVPWDGKVKETTV